MGEHTTFTVTEDQEICIRLALQDRISRCRREEHECLAADPEDKKQTAYWRSRKQAAMETLRVFNPYDPILKEDTTDSRTE